MISLLRAGETYVKMSAPYRLSKDHQMRDLQAMAREFLSVAPNRVIYATDWPHTRFSRVDISPFTEFCLECDCIYQNLTVYGISGAGDLEFGDPSSSIGCFVHFLIYSLTGSLVLLSPGLVSYI